MAGAFVAIEVDSGDIREIEKALHNLLEKTGDVQPAFRDIGEYLLRSHDERFRAGIDPDGNLWDELNPKYAAKKPKNQDKVLVLSGDLMDSLHYYVSPTELLFGTNLIYGATHQFGRPDDNIKQRRFLGISDKDKTDILTILERHLSL